MLCELKLSWQYKLVCYALMYTYTVKVNISKRNGPTRNISGIKRNFNDTLTIIIKKNRTM